MKPDRLKIGDKIGVIAPSAPVIGDNIGEIERAKAIIENKGYEVVFSKNLFLNTNGYSATAKEKAEDLNTMFEDSEIKMIWCAKGGENSNSMFEYMNFDMIKENPKIICGYSDITSITNIITEQTGLITFSGTNFKTIATDEKDFSLNDALDRFSNCNMKLGEESDYKIIQDGKAVQGKLIGGNLSLIKNLTCGKYSIDFTDKILFLEELGFETPPALASNFVYFMKQNDVFSKIKGLWIGNYTHESNISLEKIILDVIGNEFNIPIIKSNNFGHIEKKITIPIGAKAILDTKSNEKIKLVESVVK